MFDPTKLQAYNPAATAKTTSGGFNPTNLPAYTPVESQGEGFSFGGMAKSLVTAPATMIARPFQAVQSAIQLGGMDIKGNTEKAKVLNDEAYRLSLTLRTAPETERPAIKAQVQSLMNQAQAVSTKLGEDANWKPSAGGIVAEAPENWGDVKKDVGRAVQTVALGVGGSPLAAGAAFGVGSSLEQGNDLFSWDTAGSALLGLGFAKGLDKWGKPVINYVGGKLGGFVPKDLKAIAAKGEKAVLDFARQHELLGGIAKPLSEKITSGAAAFDKGINNTASSLWKGTKNVVKSQYPDVRKNYENKFENTEVKRFTDVLDNEDTKYYNARKVLKDSGLTKNEIEQTLKDTKTYAMHNTDGKSYQTMGAADEMTDKAMANGPEILRPALREAQSGARSVTNQEFRKAVSEAVYSKTYDKLSAQEQDDIIKAIIKEYRVGSPTSRAFDKYGYNLEDLYNAQLNANKYVYSQSEKTGLTSFADTLTASRKKIEAEVFKKFLVERTPKELGIENYLKEQQKRFITANFLRSLDGRPIPRSLWQKSVRTTARLTGGALGIKLGGPFAVLPGMQAGIFADEMFMKATNPVKVALLRSRRVPEAEAYKIMKDFITKSQFNRMWMKTPRLNAPSDIDIGLQGVKNQYGSIEMPGAPMTPANTIGNNITQNSRQLFNTKQLPAGNEAIRMPSNGTPNQPIAPYPSNPEVGGMRQRIFKGKK